MAAFWSLVVAQESAWLTTFESEVFMQKYSVRLTPAQRQNLHQMIATGTEAARKLLHARVLLKADQGEHGPGWTDEQKSRSAGGQSLDYWPTETNVC